MIPKILNFSFFSKSASGMIFYLMVLGFFTHELCKKAKNRIVISFLSETLSETAVSSNLTIIWTDPNRVFLRTNLIFFVKSCTILRYSYHNRGIFIMTSWRNMKNPGKTIKKPNKFTILTFFLESSIIFCKRALIWVQSQNSSSKRKGIM